MSLLYSSTVTAEPAPESGPDSGGPGVCLRTGHAGCRALFQPARYQLTLIQGDQWRRVDLGYSGSRLLERLLLRPGEVVSREELMNHAWSDRVVGQGSLNQQIYTLRQLLGDEKRRDIIQTLPRRGYLLNPDALLAAAAEPPPNPQPAAGKLATAAPRRRSPRWLWPLPVAAGMLLTLAWAARDDAHRFERHSALGDVQIRYLATDQGALERLRGPARALALQLAGMSREPLKITVSASGDYLHLLCHGQDRAQWLEVHSSRAATLSPGQLRGCLP